MRVRLDAHMADRRRLDPVTKQERGLTLDQALDVLVKAAARAGYDLNALRPRLAAAASEGCVLFCAVDGSSARRGEELVHPADP